jgi:hypothetical protein
MSETDWPEEMKLTEAARYMNVTFKTLQRILRENNVPIYLSQVDRRCRLIKRKDLEPIRESRTSLLTEAVSRATRNSNQEKESD